MQKLSRTLLMPTPQGEANARGVAAGVVQYACSTCGTCPILRERSLIVRENVQTDDAAHELLRITLQRTTAPRACHCLLRTASLCLGTSQVSQVLLQQPYIIFLKLYRS